MHSFHLFVTESAYPYEIINVQSFDRFLLQRWPHYRGYGAQTTKSVWIKCLRWPSLIIPFLALWNKLEAYTIIDTQQLEMLQKVNGPTTLTLLIHHPRKDHICQISL